MYTEADIYDLIHLSTADYSAETRQVVDLIRRARPHSRTLLDVACGTGEHARYLSEIHGFEVEGVDLSPEMIATARAKYPRCRFEVADMTNFHLGRSYDVVLCMAGSIGHVVTLPRMRDTLACLRDHLAPGGLVVVQPFLTPDLVQVGTREYVVESGGRRVTRTRRSERDGQRFRVRYHYFLEGPDGTRDADEVHEFGLFVVDEMLAAFSAVGLAATYDPSDRPDDGGRGVYIASVPD